MATNGAFISDIALQPDGRILAAGFLNWGRRFTLAHTL